ncbi:MAG: homoserine dehydrogenase [Spirochaetia bacterium]|nr:homoserine dehydrogenase [Spirochaetia bacterium]
MIRIGLFGAGTVGSGLIKILKENNFPIEVAGVVDKKYKELSGLLGDIAASDDGDALLNDDSVNVIVELMGGVGYSYEVIKKALEKGKSVVTANKHLLAKHGKELFSLAYKNNLHIGFEAAVAGAIPIIHNLRTILADDKISLVEGILNGTSNYLLTKIRLEEISYEKALKEAQQMGLAEADPTLDVNGYDACHKLALLFYVITGEWIDYTDIYTLGIEDIKLSDILWAKSMNYHIKLVASFKKEDEKNYLSVEPMMLSKDHYLHDIEFENNAVLLQAKYSGVHLFMGKGAGSLPTAYSVLADILNFGRLHNENSKPEIKEIKPAKINPISERFQSFYLRLMLADKPKVLAKIAAVLGDKNISIASVKQNLDQKPNEDHVVEVMIITHQCHKHELDSAVLELENLSDIVKEKPVFLPIDNYPS